MKVLSENDVQDIIKLLNDIRVILDIPEDNEGLTSE